MEVKKCLVAIERALMVLVQELEDLLDIAWDMIHLVTQILVLAEDLVEAGAEVEAFGGEDIEIHITSHKLPLVLIFNPIRMKKRPTWKT
jgi:hypothetical protein